MTIDSRRILGGFAVFALVLMRVVIGWHFYGEGTKKIEYDKHTGKFHRIFSADKEFLEQAKGPLAFLYLGHARLDHDWRNKLATPRENVTTEKQVDEQKDWASKYAERRAEAKKAEKTLPVEFPPSSATGEWASTVVADWRNAVNRFSAIAGMTDAQKQEAEQKLAAHLDMLATYIRSVDQDVAEYRHELWRLANWRESPEAGDLPFLKQRITAKAGETTAAVAGWREQVCQIEDSLKEDLNALLTEDQRGQPPTMALVDQALADPNEHKLEFINNVATIVTIGVGICLIFGFFTRIAAICGDLFLLGVILSQPFWISGIALTINQCVEFSALLVLAGTGAGRWAGMDGCLHALFRRKRTYVVQES